MSWAHHHNPAWLGSSAAAKAEAAIRNLRGWDGAVETIRAWPENATQPLHALPRAAARLGIAELLYKDESRRFGTELGSFKALGAPYAVSRLLASAVEQATGRRPTVEELRDGRHRAITERITVCVATDGNQGRGLAWGARTFGCRCVVYIHGHVSPHRKEAMERVGAIVIRIDGEYEASVGRAKEDARMNGWHFVSSTSWDDFHEDLPRDVMQGYMVMVEEALAQAPDLGAITHVFAQGGVGSIAAAIFLGVHDRRGGRPPRCVLVEPLEADCLFRSAVAGAPTASAGSLRTLMAGLACRDVSPAAWSVLSWLASDFVAIPDQWAVDAMRALADGGGDTPIVSGESAAGGMGVLIHAASNPALRAALGLDAGSRVLLFGCEGATDPVIYERLVGQSPDAVLARQASAQGA